MLLYLEVIFSAINNNYDGYLLSLSLITVALYLKEQG